MPSVECFMAQSESEQLALLPDDGTPIVAIEAGLGESYRRFVGRGGLIIGMGHFGESAPGGTLAEHFGFTAGQVAARVRQHLGRD